jgi:alpha-D-ribose 1-methylphosphonate 5-triphosphate synthase subunit PhnH
MAALVLTLCDMDTLLWLDPSAASPEALRFVRFHCGSPQASAPHEADFGVVLEPRDMPALSAFAPGTAEYPERSATVLVWSANLGLACDGTLAAAIRGPGIDGRGELPLHWLPEGFAAQWRANAGLFPCGVDVILAGPGAVVGLPRTVTMEG